MRATLLTLVLAYSVVFSYAWGNPPPSTCSFGDPHFEALSHQNVTLIEPKSYVVGEENFVIIQPEKPELPSGYMVSVFVDTLTSPKGEPEVQGWYPKTSIKPLDEGVYEMSVRVNLMYKGS